jgi:prevent-host-death family protein
MKVGAFEAKTQFSQLLRRVEKGETVTITRHGRPVAVLTPPGPTRAMPISEIAAAFADLRKGNRLGMSIRSAREWGRR